MHKSNSIKNFEISTIVLKEIANFFELGSLVSTRRIEQGMNNFSYFVINTQLDEFVIRILGKQTIDGVMNEYSIQKQLMDKRIVVPFMLNNSMGEFFYKKGNITATVSKKIPGRHPKHITESLSILAGKTLATFHLSVIDTKLPTNHVGWLNIYSAKNNLICLKNDTRFNTLSDLINNSETIFHQNLPKGIIHGDFIAENMLLLPNKDLIAILDFDESEENILLLDIVKTITGFCVTANGQIDIQLAKAFLNGYQKIRVITENERRHFLKALQYIIGCCAAWFIVNNFENSAKRYLNSHKNMNFYDYF